MSGTVHTVLIKADTSAFDVSKTKEFFTALWQRWVSITVGNRVRKVAYRPMLQNHFQAAGWLPGVEERFSVTDEGIRFAFSEQAPNGLLPLEAAACAHWAEVAMHVMPGDHQGFPSFLGRFGIRLDLSAIDAVAVLEGRVAVPIVEHRRKVYGVKPGPVLVPQWQATAPKLSASEKTDLAGVIESGRCECQLCFHYRPRAAKVKRRMLKWHS